MRPTISIADSEDKSCSQSHITLFTTAHIGPETRRKLQCGFDGSRSDGKTRKESGRLLGQAAAGSASTSAGSPLKSHPSRPLLIGVLVVVTVAVMLPYTPLGSLLGFIPLPVPLLGAIAFLAVTYLLLVQAVKSWFYRRHALL
jgi:hypothetical protein